LSLYLTAGTTWAIPWVRPRKCANSLAKDGTWMIGEPFANDELKDNFP
jgi:hypothetical protein